MCTCGGYKFPHRQFGGTCSFSRWVDKFFEPNRSVCVNCPNYAAGRCEIKEGIEEPQHCPELQEYVRYEGIVLYGKARNLMKGKI